MVAVEPLVQECSGGFWTAKTMSTQQDGEIFTGKTEKRGRAEGETDNCGQENEAGDEDWRGEEANIGLPRKSAVYLRQQVGRCSPRAPALG